MPNTSGGTNSSPHSLEKRLPLALALMMLVLIVSQYLFKPVPGPKPAKPINDNSAAKVVEKPAATPETAVATQAPPAEGAVQATSEIVTDIDTDLYHVILANRGAVVTSWVLKKYRDDAGKPLQLINTAAKDVPLPFAIEVTGAKPEFDPNTVLYRATPSSDGTGIAYEYSDGNTVVRKSFQFGKDSYLSTVKSEVIQNGTPVPSVLMWRGGFGDQRVHSAVTTQHTVRFDTSNNKLVTRNAKDAKNGPVTDSGSYAFGGLEDNFFAAVGLPGDSATLEIRTFSDDVKLPDSDKPAPYVGMGLSTGTKNDLSLFVGPKDVDILKEVNPKLTHIINWGFFGIIAKPLFVWLNWTKDHWTFNYGWAIVVVTIIISLALFPFRLSSLKSSRKMQALQPQIKAINEKYKNIKINDPRKAEQNQEVMALYKSAGVNPVGGCLPMLIQLPFLYAFYRVLAVAIELRHAPWLWVTDLSSPETLPIHILPVILVVSQFLAQKMTPAAGVDPNQQRMMMFMPLMFGFMFYYLSAGLVLYYLTSNLVGVAQQLIINRFMPAPAPPPPPAGKAPVKRSVKK